MSYNSRIELEHIKLIAHTDWVAARILWDLGFFYQPIWLIGQSVEKYLKVLCVQSRQFSSEKDLYDKLKKLSQSKGEPHDIGKVFSSLPLNIQKKLKKHPVTLIKTAAIRYGDAIFIAYNDTQFHFAEKFIRDVRILLGDMPKKNFLEECYEIISSRHRLDKREKVKNIIRELLSIKNPYITKKRKREIMRRLRSIVSK